MSYHKLNLQLLSISGIDAAKFLQGQLTCDINSINETRSSLGAHCNPKGRVLSLFRLFRRQHHYYMLMPSDVIVAALNALKKYAIFSKVSLDIVTTAHCYGLIDPSIKTSYPNNINEVNNRSALSTLCVDSHNKRYLLIDFTASLQPKIDPTNRWRQYDLKAGIARLYPQTIGEFLPHDLNLPQLNAVSFTKGCYTGQEIIARMQHRGKLKRFMKMIELDVNKVFMPGEKYTDDNCSGKIIDQVQYNNKNLYLLLVNTSQHRVEKANINSCCLAATVSGGKLSNS